MTHHVMRMKILAPFKHFWNFRVESEDKTLGEHFKTARRHATYWSNSTQNDISSFCADGITENIFTDIKEAKYFSILADEVTDCSTLQQIPLALWYVDQNREIERDICYCIGQCYDGAANMTGKYTGFTACILIRNPLALYTHCASHRPNLCVAALCCIQCVQNMKSSVTKVGNFLNIPKRQLLIEKMIL